MTADAQANAQAHYNNILALWEVADFLGYNLADSNDFEELTVEAKSILREVCDVNSFDDLSLNDSEAIDEYAREAALSVEVRSDWQSMGEPLTAGEFCITLTMGGPACRIIGELSEGEPSRAEIQYQDWGTPWTRLPGSQCDALNWFASLFYFGE